jgi:hypothetical protein
MWVRDEALRCGLAVEGYCHSRVMVDCVAFGAIMKLEGSGLVSFPVRTVYARENTRASRFRLW